MAENDKKPFRLAHVSTLEMATFKYRVELWTLATAGESASPTKERNDPGLKTPERPVSPTRPTTLPSTGKRAREDDDSDESIPALHTMAMPDSSQSPENTAEPARQSRRMR